LQIFGGNVFTDYTTVGWTALLTESTTVRIHRDHVVVCGKLYSNVVMASLLTALSNRAEKEVIIKKDMSIKTYLRHAEECQSTLHQPVKFTEDSNDVLTLHNLQRQVQGMLTSDTSLIVETGDSWFIGQDLVLPTGAEYNFQMQYGSIGWAVGATLGVATAVGRTRKVVLLIGDGSFQVTCQEVSTMIRQNVRAIIFLINNKGYTIEVQIHDGPYNDIKNWNYSGLIDVFNNGEGNGLGLKAKTPAELSDAIDQASKHDGVTLIEVSLDRDDCTIKLIEFGSKVAQANKRV